MYWKLLSIHPIHLSIHFHLTIHFSTYLSVCPFIYLIYPAKTPLLRTSVQWSIGHSSPVGHSVDNSYSFTTELKHPCSSDLPLLVCHTTDPIDSPTLTSVTKTFSPHCYHYGTKSSMRSLWYLVNCRSCLTFLRSILLDGFKSYLCILSFLFWDKPEQKMVHIPYDVKQSPMTLPVPICTMRLRV